MAAWPLVNWDLTRRWHNSVALLSRLVQQLDMHPFNLRRRACNMQQVGTSSPGPLSQYCYFNRPLVTVFTNAL